MDWRGRERQSCRRPIGETEVPHLEALGRDVAATRRSVDLSQVALAKLADMHPTSIARIEMGTRRTRLTTLKRIARGLGAPTESLDIFATVERWQRLVGPALAAESQYADRVERRRARRVRRKARREAASASWQEELLRRDQQRHQQEYSDAMRDLSRVILHSSTRTLKDLDRLEALFEALE